MPATPPAGDTDRLLADGIRLFNAQQWHACHDAFETLWRAEQSPLRDVYKGILQIAASMFHKERGNHSGARRLILRAVTLLTPHAATACRQLHCDVPALLAWAHSAAAPPAGITELTPPTLSACDCNIFIPKNDRFRTL